MRNRRLELTYEADMERRGKKPGWVRGDASRVIANVNPSIDTHVVHVVWLDDERVMYDQVMRCERGGGVFLPVDTNGCIGLVKQWRPQTTDMKQWRADFPAAMDVTKLGRESWEVPRGFPRLGETAADTAVREAQEETGSVVTEARMLGEVCDNTAYSPHLTEVQVGVIDLSRPLSDTSDWFETFLSGLEFFPLSSVNRMIQEGKIYDGYTLAALGMYLVSKLA